MQKLWRQSLAHWAIRSMWCSFLLAVHAKTSQPWIAVEKAWKENVQSYFMRSLVFLTWQKNFFLPSALAGRKCFLHEWGESLGINQVLGITPTLIEAHNLTWVRRPRLYWCSWPIKPSSKELLVDHGSYKHWIFPDVKGPPGTWVEDGWIHTGGQPLPTFTRALPRSRPPQNPAGLETASLEAQQRWVTDSYRFQVYQYEDNHLLWQGDQWRLPSLLERERLMGFDEQYISGMLPPKMSQHMAFNLGCSLIGNTFHVPSLVMLCHSLLFEITRDSPERDHAKLLECTNVAPAGWTKYPSFVQKMTPSPDTKELVHEILRIGDRGGTDIKLGFSIPFRLKAFPRAGVRTSVFSGKSFTVISGSIQHISIVLNFRLLSIVCSGGCVLWQITANECCTWWTARLWLA